MYLCRQTTFENTKIKYKIQTLYALANIFFKPTLDSFLVIPVTTLTFKY